MELGHQGNQAVQPHVDQQGVLADDDSLEQQLDDPLLLGREKFVPQRVELLEGLPHVVLRRARRPVPPSCGPWARHAGRSGANRDAETVARYNA